MMRAVLRALVRCYQLFFSAWINAGCRYEPSCSHYALQAHDPVPEQTPRLFSALLPGSRRRSRSFTSASS